MLAHLFRKLVLAVPLVVGVLLLVAALVELSPGDACDAWISPDMDPRTIAGLREAFGCDLPFGARLARTAVSLAMLDLGVSTSRHVPVADVLLEAAPNTLLLSAVTLAVALVVGACIGVVQALAHRRPLDAALSVVTLVLYSVPGFWLALLSILLFAPPLPSSGMVDPVLAGVLSPWEAAVDRLAHLVLPGFAMGVAAAAADARYVRSSLVEALQQDYVRTARAKGLPEARVVLHHALRNALLPLVTLLGLQLPALFSGAVLVENVFAWPGMGRVIVAAIFAQDVPLLTGCLLVFTLLVVAGGLLADVLYAVVDPRIRFT